MLLKDETYSYVFYIVHCNENITYRNKKEKKKIVNTPF